jgi:uncharacterized membrane protein (DUF4010 family)
MTLEFAVRVAVAGLGGLAVGIEREWSARASSRPPRFAGVRTFLLLGLLGGLAAYLHQEGLAAAAASLLGASLLLVVVAYGVAAARGDPDGTTEVAALLVLAAGVLAGTGRLAEASAMNAITALVLVEKSAMHGMVARLRSAVLQAAVRFGVLALVVLPLLPEGPFGPAPGLRPRELWALVLLFSGLSFAGTLALGIAGPRTGYGLAGLLGGLVSSTAVTIGFSRESRAEKNLGGALGLGVIAACTVLFARTGVLALLLDRAVGVAVLPLVGLPLAVGLAGSWHVLRRADPVAADSEIAAPANPLRLLPAIQMAVAFQVVLFIMEWMRGQYGSGGVLVSAALLGLTDVDALTFSLAKLAATGLDPGTAARALLLGALSNTILKLVIALVLGSGRFRRVAGSGLAALAAATLVALALSIG